MLSQTGNTYVGVESCGMCHKTEKQGSQLSIWQKSAHAKAFETLMTDKANQIAKEKGRSRKKQCEVYLRKMIADFKKKRSN